MSFTAGGHRIVGDVNGWMRGHLPIEWRSVGRAWVTLTGHHSACRLWRKAFGGHERVQVPADANPRLRALAGAWPCCGTGYYTLDIEGVRLPGGRIWSKRWETLQFATDYRNKTILELGCNQAILSCSLLKYRGAKQAIAVDLDKRALRAARARSPCSTTPARRSACGPRA